MAVIGAFSVWATSWLAGLGRCRLMSCEKSQLSSLILRVDSAGFKLELRSYEFYLSRHSFPYSDAHQNSLREQK